MITGLCFPKHPPERVRRFNKLLGMCLWKGDTKGDHYCNKEGLGISRICYYPKGMGEIPSPKKPKFSKSLVVNAKNDKTCPPHHPWFNQASKKCMYCNAGYTHKDNHCYRKSKCSARTLYFKQGENTRSLCYDHFYKPAKGTDMKFLCIGNEANCGNGVFAHCILRTDKCVWNLPEYGYPSCKFLGGKMICTATETSPSG